MTHKKNFMPDKLLITKNTSLEDIRHEIAKLREQKGKEKETLKLIDDSLEIGHDFIVHLYLEKALTYQHLRSSQEMEHVVLKARDYIKKHKIIKLKPRLFIFLGKVADTKKEYKKAISYYKRSLSVHSESAQKKADYNLETKSHLTYSLIMDGQVKKGYLLGKSTYLDFFNSSEGKLLRKNDYETWVIWLSGVTIRTVNALIEKKSNFNKAEIENWLKETEKYLDDKNKFSYRKMEVKELWTKLKNYKN